jgi:acetylornithine deacetylase/succinyl-diaminopimelate desuccinylase-like protein
MELTDMISEPYPGASVVPSRCRVTVDRRLLVGETADGVLAELRALPELDGIHVSIAEGEHQAYTGTVLSGRKFFPAWKLDAAHAFVQAAFTGLVGAGLTPSLGAYRFCTNAAFSAGQAGVPTVGFGPSAEGQAHVVDEYIDLDQLAKAAQGYLGIYNEVLGG